MTRSDDEVEVFGDYPPELEQRIRAVKRDESYFNAAADEELPDVIEEIEQLETDPIMARVTDADPEDFDGSRE